ncbi:hypothetical protein KYK31_03320 [Hymenobacter norwichensis]|nr:hypothetical protein [Hymenobacter norwichensis]
MEQAIPANSNWLLRGVGAVALFALLLVATLSNEYAYSVLGNFWAHVFELLGIGPAAALPEAGTSVGAVLNRPRNLPAVLSYGALYVLACLGLLFLMLPHARQRRLVLGFYGIAGTVFLLLLVLSRLSHMAVLAVLANQLLHFIVSLVPVIVLVPLLRWYSNNQPASKPTQ